MTSKPQNWIICQLGAREHYALAVELHARGRLAGLVTDAWLPSNSLLARLPCDIGRRYAERYEHSLCVANVQSIPLPKLLYQTFKSYLLQYNSTWQSIMARNEWYGSAASRCLTNSGLLKPSGASPPFVFAYSYAARQILETARTAGCHTILGQIDPGPVEEDVVAEAAIRSGLAPSLLDRAPAAYWDNWRDECSLADDIIVNSPWSRECLLRAEVPDEKIKIVPLAYKPPRPSRIYPHNYPPQFTSERPLKVLFLGQICVRKGVIELLKAASLMKESPVVFQMVGSGQLTGRSEFSNSSNVRFVGNVPRSTVAKYYAEADVFILPTLSDGFALTQLEAQSHGLPVLSTRRCGDVVRDNENGRIIDPLTPDGIAEAIRWCLDNPDALREMSLHALKRCEANLPPVIVNALTDCVEGAL